MMSDEPKPVAWMYSVNGVKNAYAYQLPDWSSHKDTEVPLYDHQRTTTTDSTDLEARLRHCSANTRDEYLHELTGRAADTIASMREENARLEVASEDQAGAETLAAGGYPDRLWVTPNDNSSESYTRTSIHDAKMEEWRLACKEMALASAEDRDRSIVLIKLLEQTREYVTDALEAMHHTNGVELLAEIDAALKGIAHD